MLRNVTYSNNAAESSLEHHAHLAMMRMPKHMFSVRGFSSPARQLATRLCLWQSMGTATPTMHSRDPNSTTFGKFTVQFKGNLVPTMLSQAPRRRRDEQWLSMSLRQLTCQGTACTS